MKLILACSMIMLLTACPDNGNEDPLDASVDGPAGDAAALDTTPDTTPDSGADLGPDQSLVDFHAPDIGTVTQSTWVSISPGTFTMGSPKTDPCREIEGLKETEHLVTLTRSFEIPTTEVTQGQFKALMWYNPSKHQACGKDCPVEMVNWHEAAAYCNALSVQKSLSTCYTCKGSGKSVTCAEATAYSKGKVYDCPGYRLPTDAEWEYAYRAKTTTLLYNGTITQCKEKDPNADKIGWHGKNSGGKSHPVAKLAPNAWGLYDMPGNVREWSHDWLINDLGTKAVTDPWGQDTEFYYRTIRGGSWFGKTLNLRAAHRFNKPPTYRCHGIGFRCVRTKTK